MTVNDAGIILKKIVVGIILVLMPALILWGGVHLTLQFFSQKDAAAPPVLFHPK